MSKLTDTELDEAMRKAHGHVVPPEDGGSRVLYLIPEIDFPKEKK